MAKKYVYFFGAGAAEGNMKMKNILGGKGANLAEMAGIGLPVPPGFTISTEVCDLFYKNGKKIPGGRPARGREEPEEARKGRRPGASATPKNPLLVSVRSGARASMPGMMDTILNLGLNDKTVAGLDRQDGQRPLRLRLLPPLRPDVRRRRPRPQAVNKDDIDPFEAIIERKKHERGVKIDTELTADDLKDLVGRFKAAIKEKTGQDFPEDPMKQLWGAIGAVFGSWINDRAIAYRKMYDIPEAWGTAVNVQLDGLRQHGRRLRHRRRLHPRPGHRRERLLRRVPDERPGRGRRGRHPHARADRRAAEGRSRGPTPQLEKIRHTLEKHYTRHDGHRVHHPAGQALHAPVPGRQADRPSPRSGSPSTWSARSSSARRKPSPGSSRTSSTSSSGRSSTRPRRKAAIKAGRLLAKGLNAGPGAATGRVVFNSDDAEAWAEAGREGHPDPHRDLARGHQGHERGRGHPDRPRRHDLARRPGRPADGQGLRRRLRRPRHRLCQHTHDRQGPDAQGRRLDLDRRHDRRGDRGQDRHQALGGPPGPHREDARPGRTPRSTRRSPRSWPGRTSSGP